MRFLRTDQLDRFVLTKDRTKVAFWSYAPTSFLYHATVDGRAVCGVACAFDDEEPGTGSVDRSRDLMACHRCQGMVFRIPHDPARLRAEALAVAAKRTALTAALALPSDVCASGKVYR